MITWAIVYLLTTVSYVEGHIALWLIAAMATDVIIVAMICEAFENRRKVTIIKKDNDKGL